MNLERKSPEQLTTLARGIITNEVFAAWDKEALDNAFGAFLSLLAGGLAEKGDSLPAESIGLVYEDMANATSLSHNGYPTFLSAKFLHKDDRIPLQRECLRMAVALGMAGQEVVDQFDAECVEADL